MTVSQSRRDISVERPYYKGISPVIKKKPETGLPITLKKKHV